MKLNLLNRARLLQALKAAGHWYIVSFHHEGENGFYICFDGFKQIGFEIRAKHILKPVWRPTDYDSPFFGNAADCIMKRSLIDIWDLCEMIKQSPPRGSRPQKINLREAMKLLKGTNG